MTAHILPGLLSAALIAAGLAMVLAGPSILIVARFLLGWAAALLAVVLALAVGAVLAFEYVATHVTVSAPHDYALAGVLTFGAISLVSLTGLRVIKPRRSATAGLSVTKPRPSEFLGAPVKLPNSSRNKGSGLVMISTPAPTVISNASDIDVSAADDAVAALRTLGYSNREAVSAVASALASLGSQAETQALVKAALLYFSKGCLAA
jgi:RuvA, C-terminal domain